MKNVSEIEWIINRRLEEARQKIIKEIEPKGTKKLRGSCFFPIEWSKTGKTEKGTDGFSGPAVNDPYLLTAYYYDSTSLSDPDYYLQIDLREAVKGMIEGHELGRGGVIDPEAQSIFKSTSAALRKLADKLDAALERK